jgi:uncharacterized protein (TIGR03437 family)
MTNRAPKAAIAGLLFGAVVYAQAPSITLVGNPSSGVPPLAPGMAAHVLGKNLGTGGADQPLFTVGGKPAPVGLFAYNQTFGTNDITIQIPVDVPLGTVDVVATTYSNVVAAPFSITTVQFAPQFIADAKANYFFDQAGNPITAAHPAFPGMQIQCQAYALGPTNPPLVMSTPVKAPAPTTTPVQVMVGGKLVQPDYAGLNVGSTPASFFGVDYQVVFKVPLDVPAGNQNVFLSVGGKSTGTVTLPVSTTPQVTAVVNGATFKAKGAAPNSFVSIFGNNVGSQDTSSNIFPATTFNGASVLFNGNAAPLYYVFGSLGQINLVLPSELAETGTVNVQIKSAQGTSDNFTLTLASADVGAFRIPDPSKAARNNGAILFANTAWRVMPASMAAALGFPPCGTDKAAACGQPAAVGDVLQIYLTGLGKATPNGDPSGKPLATGTVAPADGSVIYKTVQTPTVTIGGVSAGVLFSGIAPGNAGLYQINVAIPTGVQAGDDVPVVISMAGGSTDTVTIAVRAN